MTKPKPTRTFSLNLEPLLTIAEVAQSESCCERTIRRRIKAGELAALMDGRRIRVRPQDLEAWRKRRLSGE